MVVDVQLKDLIEMLCKAIKQRRLIRILYESKSSGKKWREIMPYMICPNAKENLELVGTPMEELKKSLKDRQPGHYLLTKLDINQLQILSATFNDPEVTEEIVVNTKTNVVCRFIYDGEGEKKVIPKWIKIEYR